jgi:hypothetical protein
MEVTLSTNFCLQNLLFVHTTIVQRRIDVYDAFQHECSCTVVPGTTVLVQLL